MAQLASYLLRSAVDFRRVGTIVVITTLCACLLLLLRQSPFRFAKNLSEHWVESNSPPGSNTKAIGNDTGGIDVVAASLTSENTSWLHEYFPEWQKKIYVVDDARASLTVPKNKGHEAMAYLTWVCCHIFKQATN